METITGQNTGQKVVYFDLNKSKTKQNKSVFGAQADKISLRFRR